MTKKLPLNIPPAVLSAADDYLSRSKKLINDLTPMVKESVDLYGFPNGIYMVCIEYTRMLEGLAQNEMTYQLRQDENELQRIRDKYSQLTLMCLVNLIYQQQNN